MESRRGRQQHGKIPGNNPRLPTTHETLDTRVQVNQHTHRLRHLCPGASRLYPLQEDSDAPCCGFQNPSSKAWLQNTKFGLNGSGECI
ncbi:hypothetical protein BC936DRAFT_146002, partial [Jimgerdemannia flammicorona]